MHGVWCLKGQALEENMIAVKQLFVLQLRSRKLDVAPCIPHWWSVERKRPTPVRKRFSLT